MKYPNKKEAMIRLTKTPKFQLWLQRTAHEVIRGKTIKQEVEEMMALENIKIEIKKDGKWVETN